MPPRYPTVGVPSLLPAGVPARRAHVKVQHPGNMAVLRVLLMEPPKVIPELKRRSRGAEKTVLEVQRVFKGRF